MILHVNGTTIPGASNLLEFIKAEVYMLPHLLDEHPECHHPVALIVQTFIEKIGIPTVKQWEMAAQKMGVVPGTERTHTPAIQLLSTPCLPSSPCWLSTLHFLWPPIWIS